MRVWQIAVMANSERGKARYVAVVTALDWDEAVAAAVRDALSVRSDWRGAQTMTIRAAPYEERPLTPSEYAALLSEDQQARS